MRLLFHQKHKREKAERAEKLQGARKKKVRIPSLFHRKVPSIVDEITLLLLPSVDFNIAAAGATKTVGGRQPIPVTMKIMTMSISVIPPRVTGKSLRSPSMKGPERLPLDTAWKFEDLPKGRCHLNLGTKQTVALIQMIGTAI